MLPAKPGGGEFIHPVPPGVPPRADAEAGPYTGPSYVAEFPDLLYVSIHIMEIKAQCAQKEAPAFSTTGERWGNSR